MSEFRGGDDFPIDITDDRTGLVLSEFQECVLDQGLDHLDGIREDAVQVQECTELAVKHERALLEVRGAGIGEGVLDIDDAIGTVRDLCTVTGEYNFLIFLEIRTFDKHSLPFHDLHMVVLPEVCAPLVTLILSGYVLGDFRELDRPGVAVIER